MGIQIVAVFYNGPTTDEIPLERRLRSHLDVFQRVVSKDPFRTIEKLVLIEEGVFIIKDKDSISGHSAVTGIKFTFTPNSKVADFEMWGIKIEKIIWALLPELQCHNVLLTKSKVEIYEM